MEPNKDMQQAAAPAAEEQQVIDFGKIFKNYLRHWWWFVISMIICLGLAFLYIKKKNPVYLVKSLVMLNQEEQGGLGGGGSLSSMMNLLGQGGGTNYNNPENEILKISSQTNLRQTVNQLHLQYNYWTPRGILRKKDWLYPHSPIAINIPQQIIDTIGVMTKFHITRNKGDKAFTVRVEQDGDNLYEVQVTRMPYSAKTPYGTFTLTLTKDYNPNEELNLYATASSTEATIDDIRERLGLNWLSKKSDAIQVDIEDVNITRGKDLINTMLVNYNNTRDRDRLKFNQAAVDFLDQRLMALYNEIDRSDTNIEHFKRDNRITDAESEATYIYGRMGAIDEQYVSVKTREENYLMFRDMLTNPSTRDNQIPFTAADLAMSEAFGQFMMSYNNLINHRAELESTQKPGSRQLELINKRIEATRATILKSLNREIATTQATLGKLNSEISQRDSRLAGMPAMEHRLMTFGRDRAVQEQIYAFLLQKREEISIDMSQYEPVGKIIDEAYNEVKPVAPKKLFILAVAFAFGLIIPCVWIQMRPARKPEDNKK